MGSVVPVMKPKTPEIRALTSRFEDVRESGQFSNFGPQVVALEHRIAEFIGAPNDCVVVVSSATSGLSAAIAELGGQKWLAPAWTFSATIAAAIQAGVDVHLGDINPDTQWLDVAASHSYDGEILVAPFGSGFRDSVFDAARRRVIDAAASIAAPLPNFSLMPESNMVVFSLHATKVLGIGEGGVVVCGSPQLAASIRRRVNFGFGHERVSTFAGFNAKMSEFQAAIGHAVFDEWEKEKSEWLEARKKVVDIQQTLGLSPIVSTVDTITPYWIIDVGDERLRNELEDVCDRLGVQTRRWWASGCHTMPAYRDLPVVSAAHTDNIAGRYLGLPFFRGIEDYSLDLVTTCLREVGFR